MLPDGLRRVAGGTFRSLGHFAPALSQGIRHFSAHGNFAIFHVGRSGSRLLADLLDQHSAIHCDREIFNAFYGEAEAEMSKRGFRTEYRWNTSAYFPHDPLGYVRSRLCEAGPRAWYCCEVKFYHVVRNGLTVPGFVNDLEGMGFDRFVVLERRNTLRKIVSSAIGHLDNRFHAAANSQASATRIELDVDRIEIDSDSKPLIAYLEDYADRMDELRVTLADKRALWLSYEGDLQHDPSQGYRRVCDFLGLEGESPSVRTRRTNPQPLSEIVTNWEDVRRTLTGTRFESMLEG